MKSRDQIPVMDDIVTRVIPETDDFYEGGHFTKRHREALLDQLNKKNYPDLLQKKERVSSNKP